MSEPADASLPARDAHYAPPSAGDALRATREAAGMTIHDVAQQLKLAPRQVLALEQGDYANLPGRTFVRGFVRNYARILQLDPEEVLALLPDAEVASALARPSLTTSGRPMGELPAYAPVRWSWTRWAIPLALIAIVVAAGVYEFRRQQSESRHGAIDKPVGTAAAPAMGAGTSSAALSNPLAPSSEPTAPQPASSVTGGAQPAPDNAAATSLPAAPGNATAPAPESALPSGNAASPSPNVDNTGAAPAAPATAVPQLVFTFTGTSWVQVKDRNGNLLIAQNGQAGSTQTVSGPPPLEVVIGNVRAVTATFGGRPVDPAPYVRGDVARFTLK